MQFIGDSITYGYGLTTASPPPTTACSNLTTANPTKFFYPYNQGINGSTSADWAATGTGKPLTNAIAQLTKYNITTVCIALGTNDAKPTNNFSAATFQTNMQSIITSLKGAGVTKIVLNQPPYIQASASGLPDPTSANALLVAYHTSQSNLATADPTVVFLGDTTAYSTFQAQPTYYQTDGIHPNDTGANALGGLWQTGYPNP